MEWLAQYSPILELTNVLATATIALIAFLYSRRATRMAFILQSTEMLNSVNNAFLASEDNLTALADIRGRSNAELRRDYLMLKNLNYLHAIWTLRQEHAINAAMADAKLDNGATFWIGLDPVYLSDMLSRGFPRAFQNEMSDRVAAQRARLKGQAQS